MALAAPELERVAIRYANDAVQADKSGSRGTAIAKYQQAIEVLSRLVTLYPSYELNGIYIQRIKAYQQRVRILKGDAFEEAEVEAESGARVTPSNQSPQKSRYEELVLKEKPTVKWDEVIGLEDAKRAIRESVVYPTKRPDLFPLGWPRGILMYGPPGCGKTLLAAATAAEIEATFISVDAAAIMSRWLGEAEKNVSRIFNQARSTPGSVIVFIDEVDALFGMHQNEVGGEVRVRNQFLQEMDGLSEKGRTSSVYVIAATNKPWELDPPFIRRFQKRIMVSLPDAESLRKTFELYSRNLKLAPEVTPEAMERLLESYTPSDIRDICQSAQLRVVRELFETGQADKPDSTTREITLEDFKEVIGSRKPSVSADMLHAYQVWCDNFRAL
ncbi:MAG: AAA family ATPase [Thermoprotei archaeon]